MFMVGSLSVHFLKSLMQELRTFKKIGSIIIFGRLWWGKKNLYWLLQTILKNQITLKNNGENIEYEDRFSAI